MATNTSSDATRGNTLGKGDNNTVVEVNINGIPRAKRILKAPIGELESGFHAFIAMSKLVYQQYFVHELQRTDKYQILELKGPNLFTLSKQMTLEMKYKMMADIMTAISIVHEGLYVYNDIHMKNICRGMHYDDPWCLIDYERVIKATSDLDQEGTSGVDKFIYNFDLLSVLFIAIARDWINETQPRKYEWKYLLDTLFRVYKSKPEIFSQISTTICGLYPDAKVIFDDIAASKVKKPSAYGYVIEHASSLAEILLSAYSREDYLSIWERSGIESFLPSYDIIFMVQNYHRPSVIVDYLLQQLGKIFESASDSNEQ
jgi:hypothetical protein